MPPGDGRARGQREEGRAGCGGHRQLLAPVGVRAQRAGESGADGHQARLEELGVVNGRLQWTSLDDRWEVALWGRNLGDKEYIVYGFDLSIFGFNQEMLGVPRTLGVEATLRF